MVESIDPIRSKIRIPLSADNFLRLRLPGNQSYPATTKNTAIYIYTYMFFFFFFFPSYLINIDFVCLVVVAEILAKTKLMKKHYWKFI
jgi:hypothetical protein